MGSLTRIDYGVIKLDDDVQLVSSGNPRICTPAPFMQVKRVGADAGILQERQGMIKKVVPNAFTMSGEALPGASGGPVISAGGCLQGIASGPEFFPGLLGLISTRMDVVKQHLDTRGGVGAGLTLV